MSSIQLSGSYTLSLIWDPPDNSKKFDLDHFKVHIILPEQDSYIANGTSMEPEYHFHSDNVLMVPAQNSIHVTVTAVSKCSQQGLSGPFAIEVGWREVTDKTNIPAVSKTGSGPNKYELNQIQNGTYILFISLPHTYSSSFLFLKGYKVMIANVHKGISTAVIVSTYCIRRNFHQEKFLPISPPALIGENAKLNSFPQLGLVKFCPVKFPCSYTVH
jgi:hypothetical protein